MNSSVPASQCTSRVRFIGCRIENCTKTFRLLRVQRRMVRQIPFVFSHGERSPFFYIPMGSVVYHQPGVLLQWPASLQLKQPLEQAHSVIRGVLGLPAPREWHLETTRWNSCPPNRSLQGHTVSSGCVGPIIPYVTKFATP